LSQKAISSKIRQNALFCLLALAGLGNAHAQETRVAIFDSQRVIRESAPAKAAEEKIRLEFSKQSKSLEDQSARLKAAVDKFEKESPNLSELERTRRQRELAEQDQDFARKKRIFNEDLNMRKNEELSLLVERAVKVVKQIAEAEKYDIVLQDAVYFSPRVDITDKVLKALSK